MCFCFENMLPLDNFYFHFLRASSLMLNYRVSLQTRSWLCFTHVTRTRTRTRRRRWRTPHQNLAEGGVLEGLNLTLRLLMGFWLSLGVRRTHVRRRTPPKSAISENTKKLNVTHRRCLPKIFLPKFFFWPNIFWDKNFVRICAQVESQILFLRKGRLAQFADEAYLMLEQHLPL